MPPNTLADALHSLSRFFPDTLTTSSSWDRGMALANQLPALLCPYSFGFEMPLHQPLKSVDMAFCITQPGCDILAGTYPVAFPSAFLSDPGIWPAIKGFCRLWADPSSGLYERIVNLWLEFFLQNKDASLYPVPFIKLKKDTAWKTWLPDTLEILNGKKIPDQVKQNLMDYLEKLPSQIRVFQAGIRGTDGNCSIRLCLEGVEAGELPDFLQTVGIKAGNSMKEYMDLLTGMDRICVHIDIGKSIGPAIGIELRQAPEKELCLETQAEWDRVLDFLTGKNLCIIENNSFLKGFRGVSYEWIHPDLMQFLTCRFLYYLKAVFHPEKQVRVKAYFGFVNRTAVPPLEKRETPSLLVHKQLSYSTLKAAIRRGVSFLARNQLPHGEFNTYIAHDNCLKSAVNDGSPFATAFVLYCTRNIPGELFGPARKKTINFLLREGFPGYIWKYWTHASGKTIAPDLDDTCCISFILQKLFQLSEVGENIPAILANRDEKGLFKTWIKDPEDPNDLDIAVNANVLLYLGEREETKASVNFIKERIIAGDEKKYLWYYPDILACYYMIARAAHHGVDGLRELFPVMTSRILKGMDKEGKWKDELSTALAVCALQYMDAGEKCSEQARLWLINRQKVNGSWQRFAAYTGPEPSEPHSIWFGSEELTMAFCLEGLCRVDSSFT